MREAHIRRWQIGVAFAALTLIFVLGLLRVQHDSASIHDLQRTNCGLYRFLVTAERARLADARHEKGSLRRQDERAATGYAAIAARFLPGIGHSCRRRPFVFASTTTGTTIGQ